MESRIVEKRLVTLLAAPGDRFKDRHYPGQCVVVTSVVLSEATSSPAYWVKSLSYHSPPWAVSEMSFLARFVPEAKHPKEGPVSVQCDSAAAFAADLVVDAHRLQNLSDELAKAVNRVSAENGSNTPDFILGVFLAQCLEAFDLAMQTRAKWYGKPLEAPGRPD